MIDNVCVVKFKFYFGVFFCVFVIIFEMVGVVIDVIVIEDMFQWFDIYYLVEMMNYFGVLYVDEEVMKKIVVVKKVGKFIDGYVFGFRGEDVVCYVVVGIIIDYECFMLEEVFDKLVCGMKIFI